MTLTINNISKSYGTNLTLWLAVAIAAVSAMMMPAKRMFVK